MTILTAAPKKWYSWNFAVTDGGRPIADMNLSAWREKGVLNVEGINYRVYRKSAMGDFVLERDGAVLARATKPSAFHRSFTLNYNDRQYTLRARSAFRRAFIVLDGDMEIGSIAPHSAWTRKTTIDLPNNWPLPLQAFAVWLTIILWKRDSDGGAVVAAPG